MPPGETASEPVGDSTKPAAVGDATTSDRALHRRLWATVGGRRPALISIGALAAVILVVVALLVFRDTSSRRARTVGARRPADRSAASTTQARATGRSQPAQSPTTKGSVHGTPVPRPSSRSRAASFTMLFAGDLLPHGPVDRMAAQYGRATGQAYDFAPLLAAMKPLVSSADLAICHMETPVSPDQSRITTYPVFGAPIGLVKGIRDTGYDGCSTASNHSLDKGRSGIAATIWAFNTTRLGHAGTYTSAQDAARIQMYDVKGVKVAHLSYAYGFNGIPIPADAPYAVNQIDQAKILAAAKRARAAGAQFVVVSLHWGNEYQPVPNAQQLALAPALTASPDIDLIVGHHVHVVQPIVRENGKFVVFGMGNQLSNQTQDLRRDGLTVLVTVSRQKDGRYAATRVHCIPTYVDQPALRVYPVTPTLADSSTPPGLRRQLEASLGRTMAAVNSRGVTPGVTVFRPAHP